ncbi:MAG TPA: hypothetical protein VJ400_09245 [Thermoplasmata archaeon]|nr:hypothetical protein [Thermoplasmata archaeon]
MRNPLLALSGIVALLFAASPAAASSGVTTLNPGEAADVVTATLGVGDSIVYQWSTGLSVEFLIARAGVEVFTTTGPVGQGTYAITVAGTYVVSFHNSGPYLSIVSWNVEPRVSASTLPLLVGAAAAGAVGLLLGLLLWQRRRRAARPTGAYPQAAYPPAGPPQNPGA